MAVELIEIMIKVGNVGGRAGAPNCENEASSLGFELLKVRMESQNT